MKILLEKIKKLEQLEKAADEAESRYTEEPENAEFESAFDKAYKAEFAAYIDVARYIEHHRTYRLHGTLRVSALCVP